MPNSAGTTAADLEAKSTFWFRAIKINAITIVDGRVPKMPPVFVPYRSAINIIRITIIAERINGRTT